ncbi:Uncharacterised protein (plasmid) [Tsukamurella tyrosinosolvens]|nr:MspA family porin [Tsukamurella tyrosinosolvens]VEH95944.1 Uncharacterised protein [Tsukamurella tyrosinosolvens]
MKSAGRRGSLEQRRRDRAIRKQLWRTGAVGVVGATVLAGGVVAAAPPAADKAPRPGAIRTGLFADTSRALETREGYVIRAWKYGEELRSIIPLGRALNTYEAIVSIAGEGLIEYKDPKNKPKVPIRSASITVGLTLACAAPRRTCRSRHPVERGERLGDAVTVRHWSVPPRGPGRFERRQGSGSVNGSITPGISGTLGDTITTSGTMTGTIAPGTSKDFPIARRASPGSPGTW